MAARCPAPPELALAVRQPWAWAIIYAAKDIENRSAKAVSFMTPLCGRRAIHASKSMTREEYEDARDFMRALGIACPPPAELQRGGIIGSVEITGCVSRSESRWFFGPRGLVLADPQPCEFIPARGELGYFRWLYADAAIVPAPARWMLPKPDRELPLSDPPPPIDDLFGGAT